MSYYITRIFNNKLKLGVILFIFAAPILDVLKALIDVSKGAAVPFPALAAFLVLLWEAVQRHLQWHFQTDLSFIR